MKKLIFLLIIGGILFSKSDCIKAQGFTPPEMIFGLTLDGNFATNDAHGSSLTDPNTYSMVWGRGFSIYGKYGLGVRKNHRIIASASYNKMINDTENKIPFFVFKPSDPNQEYTNYSFYTFSLGWEYGFNPRCRSKQFLGVALTANVITSDEGSKIKFNNATRFGVAISTGYEFVLDKNYKTGLTMGLKYHLTNILGTSNNVAPNIDLNDGSGPGGPAFWRRIGVLSLNLGINFYTGVKPYRLK